MVADLLTNLGKPGTFVTRERLSPSDLHLEVEGVGAIGFPISTAKARALCRVARQARHGLRDRTLLDVTVRDTWEIAKTKVKIDQRRWKRALGPALDRIRDALGLAPGVVLDARLHNMLVYAPGQFFVSHQDSEKADGMIGTLVVTLPSEFDGGAMVVQHHDEKVSVRGSPKDLALVAFYADCHHEVRPVKAGHRVVLTYDLFVSGAGAAAFAVPPARLDALQERVRDFFRTAPVPRWAGARQPEPPDRLVYLLDHQYTEAGLDWTRLKNADAVRASALREVAGRLDCEIALALADVHESWSCEDDEDEYRYRGGRGRYRRWSHAEDDGETDDAEDAASVPPALIDLIDSSVELRHFVDAEGRRSAISSHVDPEELCFAKPSGDLDPFRSEHEGYMGNWGNTVDRWYHRAAIVLWPRARTFVIRAKASGPWAIGEIAKALGRGRLQDGRRMTAELLPFWARVVGDDRSKRVATTLRVARDLEDPALAAALVRPFRVEHLAARTAPALFDLVERYGLRWFQKSCAQFLASVPQGERGLDPHVPNDRRLAWLGSLPAFARTASEDDRADAIPLAVSIVTEQWRWMISAYRSAMRLRPSAVLESLAQLDRAILALVETSVVLEAGALHDEMTAFLASHECPALALVRLLRAATATYDAKAVRALGLEGVRVHAVEALTEDLRAPERASSNWSIAAPSACACSLCVELGKFLVDRSRTRCEWPLAQERRAHVHGILDRHELPVTHTTRRSGRPYTLVLEKTRALFEREAASRAAKRDGLAWLSRRTSFGRTKTLR